MDLVPLLLAAGACFSTGGDFTKCALQPLECGDQIYRSSAWLKANLGNTANQCADQETIRKLQSMGRCDGTADRFICTSHKTACRFSAVFKPLTTDCNLVEDLLQTNSYSNAHFGFCRSSSGPYCAWQFKECKDPGEWNGADPFFANNFPTCHCDDVRTGACVDTTTNSTFCAITKEVCEEGDGYTYIPVLDLESNMKTQCNLCDTLPEELIKGRTDIDGKPKETTTEESPTTETTEESPTGTTTEESPVLGGATEGDNENDEDSEGLGTGVIVGIAVGSVVALFLIAIGVRYAVRHAMEPDVSDAETIGSLPSIK